MATERLRMRQVREVLRLKHECGLPHRAIAGPAPGPRPRRARSYGRPLRHSPPHSRSPFLTCFVNEGYWANASSVNPKP